MLLRDLVFVYSVSYLLRMVVFVLGVCVRRPANKQSAANTTIGVTENLMNLSRMMSSQVKQSEQTMETLGVTFFVFFCLFFFVARTTPIPQYLKFYVHRIPVYIYIYI